MSGTRTAFRREGEAHLRVKDPVRVVPVGGALVETVVASPRVVQIAVAPHQRESREEAQQLQTQRHCQLLSLLTLLLTRSFFITVALSCQSEAKKKEGGWSIKSRCLRNHTLTAGLKWQERRG